MSDNGEITAEQIHRDVWDAAVWEWDAATRQHFRNVTAAAKKDIAASGGRRGAAPGNWLLEDAEKLDVIWGTQHAPLMLDGEGLMVAGPQGVGKTTIAQQFALALVGLRDDCLGLPVRRERGKVLYLAMDRPEQVRRSFRRMLTAEDASPLAERMVIWRGPLPFSVTHEPARLAAFVREHGATHVIVDSYKDLASDLSKEFDATQINLAAQECIAEGIGWTGIHHTRKANPQNPHPKELADIYGSNWLTAGLGSVISIYGEPGDELIEAKHVKQPAESLGTFGIRHEHAIGHSELTDDRPEISTKTASKGDDKVAEIVQLLRDNPDQAFDAVILAARLDVKDRTIRGYMPKVEAEHSVKRIPGEGRSGVRWQWIMEPDASA